MRVVHAKAYEMYASYTDEYGNYHDLNTLIDGGIGEEDLEECAKNFFDYADEHGYKIETYDCVRYVPVIEFYRR